MVERLYLWIQDRWVSRQPVAYAVECNVSRGTTVVHGCSGMQRAATSLGNGYSGTTWTLDQVKYLFLSVDD